MRLRLTRNRRARRRLALLAAACFAMLVTGMEIGSRADQDGASSTAGTSAGRQQPDPLEGLSLRQQVGQLLIMRFEGTERPTYVRDALSSGEAGGVILFGDNVASEQQLRALTESLQQAAGGSALVAADQEGGEIRTVPFAAPETAASAITEPRTALETARTAARDIARLGVNVNLAPVADVASVPGSVMATRAYPGEPDQVAELVTAAIRGNEAGGVAATVKHFPGIGSATENTDDASVTIERSLEQLADAELVPFAAAAEADAPLIMAGHALYPAIDEERIASQSPVVLEQLLRDELGYEGVVVTDSMEAQAVLDESGTVPAAVDAVDAGSDLILMTSSGSWEPVLERLVREAERSDRFRARVEESARRVLELKQRLGLDPPVPLG